jgi:hypothetical protein
MKKSRGRQYFVDPNMTQVDRQPYEMEKGRKQCQSSPLFGFLSGADACRAHYRIVWRNLRQIHSSDKSICSRFYSSHISFTSGQEDAAEIDSAWRIITWFCRQTTRQLRPTNLFAFNRSRQAYVWTIAFEGSVYIMNLADAHACTNNDCGKASEAMRMQMSDSCGTVCRPLVWKEMLELGIIHSSRFVLSAKRRMVWTWRGRSITCGKFFDGRNNKMPLPIEVP